MAKEIETTNEAGETVKETVYTTQEYTARETELNTVQAELAEAKRVNAERGESFTAYSKMTEEQKKTFDANTTNLLKREEALTAQLAEMNIKLTDKEKNEIQSAKTTALASVHHGDEATKKTLEEKYDLLSGMPETTQAEISARTREAAKLAGIQIDQRNPLYTGINGDAPTYKPNKEYVDTPEGKIAADMAREAMGIKS